jgi:hypothetical protein
MVNVVSKKIRGDFEDVEHIFFLVIQYERQ